VGGMRAHDPLFAQGEGPCSQSEGGTRWHKVTATQGGAIAREGETRTSQEDAGWLSRSGEGWSVQDGTWAADDMPG
jgi:hypothetical protein